MTKKIMWTIVALAIVGYFVNSNLKDKAKRESEQSEAKKIEQSIKSAVAEMVSSTNAIDDWKSSLSRKQRHGYAPIFTVTLEKLWMKDRPILFVGAIKDITTYDDSHYTVRIGRRLYFSLVIDPGTALELSLRCSKSVMDTFLNKHPGVLEGNNNVAVSAHVESIRRAYLRGEVGEPDYEPVQVEVKIGDGELIDIRYAGAVRFLNVTSP